MGVVGGAGGIGVGGVLRPERVGQGPADGRQMFQLLSSEDRVGHEGMVTTEGTSDKSKEDLLHFPSESSKPGRLLRAPWTPMDDDARKVDGQGIRTRDPLHPCRAMGLSACTGR